MASLAEIRAKYPQYGDMSDGQLADALHRKFYADMPRGEFDAKVGARGSSYESPIDKSRPRLDNADGSFSTEETIGIEADGRFFNIPTIVGGKRLSEQDAIDAFMRGENPPVGEFDSQEEADQAATSRSRQIGDVRGREQAYKGGTFSALTEGSHAGLMGGYDDEITAGMLAPVDAAIDWAKGDGFDIGKAYTRKQQMLDAQKTARREEHPVASIAGEVAGGLALGGGAARAGLSLGGKALPVVGKTGAAAVEGGTYGALYGSGEAAPGERLQGAAEGAAVGAVTGGLLERAGSAIATRSARKVANAAAPTADDLGQQSRRLYQASEAQGVRFNVGAVTKLRDSLIAKAGRINEKNRPLTSGTVDDANKMLNGEMSLEELDEFRQGINLDLKSAKGQDRLYLTRLKSAVDDFADNVSAADMTGGPAGVPILKEARQIYARHKKMQTIERLLDFADMDGTGKYTQSGFANAIRQEMKTLYKAIKRGKEQGWTDGEIALIRQMASGGSSSRLVNLFAKFAPRGVVSIAAGSMLPGSGAAMIGGHLAGEAADRGAMAAARALSGGVATGQALGARTVKDAPKWLRPFIPAAIEATYGAGRALGVPR